MALPRSRTRMNLARTEAARSDAARTPARFLIVAAAAVLALAAVPTVVARAATATPKLGGTCTKAQAGKTTSTLVCAKSGSAYRWAKRATATTKKGTASVLATPIASPSNIDVVAIPIGTAPAAMATKVDVKCSGLGATPNEATNTVNFGPQGGTNAISFALLEPGASNPTGSSCLATATVTGATPSLRILVAGRPSAGPATGTTLSTPAFTAAGPLAITVIIDLGTSGAGGIATPLTTVPSAATTTVLGTTTTLPGASTTTTPPPASGKPEVTVKFFGTVPAGVTSADTILTCTAAVAGGPFQTQTARLPIAGGVATIAVALAPPSGTFAGTSCQLEARVNGDATAGTASLRLLLNGNLISGPTTGNLINSPTFAAPRAFSMTFEIGFGGATAASTTTTTLIPGSVATTTTIAGAVAPPATSSIVLTRIGTAPIGVTDYGVAVECTNVLIGAQPYGSVKPSTTFGAAGGTLPLNFTLTATSTCSITVTTGGTSNTTAGTVAVALNGVPRASSPGGSISVPPFSAPAPFTVQVTISY